MPERRNDEVIRKTSRKITQNNKERERFNGSGSGNRQPDAGCSFK